MPVSLMIDESCCGKKYDAVLGPNAMLVAIPIKKSMIPPPNPTITRFRLFQIILFTPILKISSCYIILVSLKKKDVEQDFSMMNI